MEITQKEQQTEKQMKKKKKNESNIWDLWDNINHANLCIIGAPREEEREKGIKNVFEEIMAENVPNLKWTDIQTQEAQGVPNKINPNRHTPKHNIIKMAKFKHKERILEAAKEKQRFIYKGTPVSLSADFSAETWQARREWHDTLKVLKGKDLQPRILYP